MPKHTLTPAYDDALRQFAERLPTPDCSGQAPRLGSDLLAEDPTIRDRNGKPLDPDKKYFVAVLAAVNHHRRLRKAYLTGGQPAVVKYLQPYAEFLKQE